MSWIVANIFTPILRSCMSYAVDDKRARSTDSCYVPACDALAISSIAGLLNHVPAQMATVLCGSENLPYAVAMQTFSSLSYPQDTAVTAASVVKRMVQGLAFRFFHATNNLRSEDFEFAPADDCMSASDLCKHILGLSKMIARLLGCELNLQDANNDLERRQACLDYLDQLCSYLDQSSNELGTHEQFWNCFNGPLADALTHVGQLNSWRRLNGNPLGKVNFFNGQAAQAD